MGSPSHVPLHLDHVSVVVPRLVEAVDQLHLRLGLRATASTADPNRHSRVYLDHSYLEVAAQAETTEWHATHFFFRFGDLHALRAHLDACGLVSRFGLFEGVDGRWDDVEIVAGSIPMPILVRRTDPPKVARNWPPPLSEPHRCGAQKLAAVYVAVSEWQPAITAYRRLLGLVDPAFPVTRLVDGGRRIRLPLASGHLVLVEAEQTGLAALVLSVGSINETAAFFGRRLTRADNDPVAWLDPAGSCGLRLGFVETQVATDS